MDYTVICKKFCNLC